MNVLACSIKLTSKSLQFLFVSLVSLPAQGVLLSIGMEISYVPNGLVHSSAPRSMSHGESLRKWQHIGCKRMPSFAIQKTESSAIVKGSVSYVLLGSIVITLLQNVVRTKKWRTSRFGRLVCSVTEQAHGNMESNCSISYASVHQLQLDWW